MSAQVSTMVGKLVPTNSAHDYAMRLAWALWEKHWKEDAPDWQPLPDCSAS